MLGTLPLVSVWRARYRYFMAMLKHFTLVTNRSAILQQVSSLATLLHHVATIYVTIFRERVEQEHPWVGLQLTPTRV